jgi:hypothetical protein
MYVCMYVHMYVYMYVWICIGFHSLGTRLNGNQMARNNPKDINFKCSDFCKSDH